MLFRPEWGDAIDVVPRFHRLFRNPKKRKDASPPISHQTIKLSKGQHSSADEGACVMELASMLAGEPFTDLPASVCPVIASFLRAYNDTVNDEQRRDLYPYAAKVVGSRASIEVQRRRAKHLAAWRSRKPRSRFWQLLLNTGGRMICSTTKCAIQEVGVYAVQSIRTHTAETHAAALALIDELLAITEPTGKTQPDAPAWLLKDARSGSRALTDKG